METRLACHELAIRDCSYVARGEELPEVVAAMVDHLEAEHDIHLTLEEVMADPPDDGSPEAMVAGRIRQKLSLEA